MASTSAFGSIPQPYVAWSAGLYEVKMPVEFSAYAEIGIEVTNKINVRNKAITFVFRMFSFIDCSCPFI